MTTNGHSTATGKVLSPSKLAHVVLRTNQFDAMVKYYKTFLGATASFENDFLSFLTYDEEHHRIALLSMPNTTDKVLGSCGLEHIAFTFDSLKDLCTVYQQRKSHGMKPVWCVNHGPTTSMYYSDPDGNQIESQVDNYDTTAEASAFIMAAEFEENPIGVDFDPEELCRRVFDGKETDAEIKRRPNIGKRGPGDVSSIMQTITGGGPVKAAG